MTYTRYPLAGSMIPTAGSTSYRQRGVTSRACSECGSARLVIASRTCYQALPLRWETQVNEFLRQSSSPQRGSALVRA